MFVESNDGFCFGCVETSNGVASFSVRRKYPSTLFDISTLSVDAELSSVLGRVKDVIWFKQKLMNARTLEQLAAALEHALEIDASTKVTSGSSALPHSSSESSSLYLPPTMSAVPIAILGELQELGWSLVSDLKEDFSVITFALSDCGLRKHFVDIHLSPSYPNQCPRLHAALPRPIPITWHPQPLPTLLNHLSPPPPTTTATSSSTECWNLVSLVRVIRSELTALEQYFKVLDDLDMHTWVLEPAQPSYAITTRRIALERAVSVVVDIDPLNPMAACEMRFLGPTSRVTQLRENISNNITKWNKRELFRLNLQTLLGFLLPVRCGSETETLAAECGICYSYSVSVSSSLSSSSSSSTHYASKLPSASTWSSVGPGEQPLVQLQVPDQLCGNSRCNRVYHTSCLVTWMQSLPTSRTSFGTVFGSCPYCKENIGVKIGKTV